MKAGGSIRALRYFIRQAELYVVTVIGLSFAMAVYIWLLNDYGISFNEVLASVPETGIYVSMIVLFVSGASSSQYWYSIPISFGCLRKNAFLGALVMDALFIVESMLFYKATAYFFRADAFRFGMLSILVIFLLLEGLSKFLGVAMMKWGKIAYVVMIAMIIAGTMAFGLIVGYNGVKGMLLSFISALDVGMLTGQWILLAAAAVVCLVANAANYRIVSRYEVKA